MLKHSVRGTIAYIPRRTIKAGFIYLTSNLKNVTITYIIAYWKNGNWVANVSGAKCQITLKIHISVTYKKKLNDLQKSIATEPFYVHSEFDMLSSLVSGEM